MGPSLKKIEAKQDNTSTKMGWVFLSVGKHLPSMLNALGSTLAQKEKEKEKEKQGKIYSMPNRNTNPLAMEN